MLQPSMCVTLIMHASADPPQPLIDSLFSKELLAKSHTVGLEHAHANTHTHAHGHGHGHAHECLMRWMDVVSARHRWPVVITATRVTTL